uniref:Prepilin-type N-terminal cleavage/methylation domain-containing protein n=1 Tax=Dictyoglomus thermophilum TaxID=14 RepID=A0A7C3RH70_DICTH
MTNLNGYTLIELLITVIIIGILSYISFHVTIASLDRANLNSCAILILKELVELRDSAYSCDEGTPNILFFFPSIDKIVLKCYDKKSNFYKITKIIDLREENIDLVSSVFGVNEYVYFNRLGIPSSGGTVVIRYKNMRKYVVVTPATGRIYISDKMPED